MVGSCAEVGEPYVGSVPTTEVAADTLPLVSDAEPSQVEVIDEDTPPTTDRFLSPPAPDGYVADLLAVADGGVLLGPLQTWRPLEGVVGNVAFDDLFGGLVTQDENGTVRWYRPGEPEPGVVSLPPGQLVGVMSLSAAPAAVVADGLTISIVGLLGPDGELGTGEVLGAAELAEGQTRLGYSARAGLQAIAVGNEECGDVIVQRLDGDVLDVGPPEPGCPVPRRPEVTAVALGPDGTELAYLRIDYRDDGVPAVTELVVMELATGVQRYRAAVGESGEVVRGLAFDGSRVAFVVSGPARSQVAVVTVASGQLITREVEDVTSVRFARLPVTIETP